MLSAPSLPASMPSLDVWMGMPHGFVTEIGKFNAATQALRAIGESLTERLGKRALTLTTVCS